MNDLQQKLLQKEIDYYTNLLEKHETISYRKPKLQSLEKQSQNSHWKQPPLPVYKMIKTSSLPANANKINAQLSSTNAVSPNKRTVLFNETKFPKAKSEASQNIGSSKLPVNKVFSKRTVIHNQNPVMVAKNSSVNSFIPSCSSKKFVSSESEGLLKEIAYLTKLLESSNEKPTVMTKDNPTNSVVNRKIIDNQKKNFDISISQCLEKNKITLHTQTANLPCLNLKQNCKSDIDANRTVSNTQFNVQISKPTNFSKYSLKKVDPKQNVFSKTKHPFKVENNIKKCSTLNKYVSDSRILTNTACSNDVKFCKQNDPNPFKVKAPKHHQILDKRQKGPSKYKVINKQSSAILKVNSPSTLKSKASLIMRIKSPASSKIVTKHRAVYSKINKGNQSPLMKQHLKNKFVFRRNSPANQKAKKVNLKYKVVNKSNTRSINRVLNRQNSVSVESSLLDKSDSFIDLLDNSDIDNLEQRLLAVSTSLTVTPDDKEIENLEQRLLAVSTSLTATPKPVAKCPLNDTTTSTKSYLKKTPKCKVLASKYKVVNKNVATKVNSKLAIKKTPAKKYKVHSSKYKVVNKNTASKINSKLMMKKTPAKKFKVLSSKYKVVNKNEASKVNSKLVIKKTPAKKFKLLSSKYKVVNKNVNTPKNFSFTSKDNTLKNSARKVCKKIFSTKFSIVNKHSSVSVRSPSVKANSTLVKRLYKSKSTIINKNVSPTNHSAKLIKTKYLGLYKRKSPCFQKHSSYLKRSMKLPKFKGPYVDNRLQSKLNSYQKCMTYSKGTRRFSKNINYVSSGRYHKNNSTAFKHKRNNVYARSPVLLIRGTRYSMSSAGKTLKRLPTKVQTKTNKIPRRIIIGGKPFVRTSENMMKVVNSPPISVHIASRVLHRSINRVLTASSKKSLTKVNTYCMFYNRFGRCNRGVKCTYIHDPSKIAVCTRFLRGTCKTEACPFSHEVSPGKMAICSFFLVDACDKANCPYRHEPLSPNAVLCKAFVQGYCPHGNKCKKAHILICPKFILGECEKGSTCAYPHPPQKVKKNAPKDTVVEKDVIPSEKKDDDALLEKVTRYFLPLCGNPSPCKNTSEKAKSIQFLVPKQRRQLEEQPAFIPLSDTPVTSRLNQPKQN